MGSPGEPMTVLDRFRLDGKVAVVTGGNRGLGYAFARALGEAGARVVIAARDHARSERVARELGATAVTMDVTSPESVAAMLDTVSEALGPVDVLINNAGVCVSRAGARSVRRRSGARSSTSTSMGCGTARRWSDGRWSSGAAARSSTSGRSRRMIVNRPQWQPAYNASKAAVHQLTKSLAAEWAPYSVRVERARARLRQDGHGAGRRAAVPPPLD